MASASIGPRPCTDPNCDGRHDPAERVALAASICDERGAKLTDLRREILEILWETRQPTGAYALLGALKAKEARRVGPPTIYRTLDFLVSHGLVSKIESKNAYVPCVHPERERDCLYYICSNCGATIEVEDSRIDRLISENAASIGFRPKRCVIEVEGECASCNSTSAI